MSDTNNSFAPDDSSSSTVAAGADATRSSNTSTKAVLASFNVLHGRIANGPVDLDKYAEVVAGLGADFVGLQEVDKAMLRTSRAHMAAVAGKRAGMNFYFGKAIRRLDLGFSGLAVLAKGPLVASRIKLPRSSWFSERRIAIEAHTEIKGVAWTIFNAHLSLDKAESEEQLKYLLTIGSAIDGPCVVMGDFNRSPDEVAACVAGDWLVAESGPTYPSWNPDKRIDFVVVRNAVAESVEVKATPISDHCALRITVSPEDQA